MVKLATICYIDNGKEWLMLYRNKNQNDIHYDKWLGVGGKFEPGETPQTCAKREIFEETGLVVTDLELKGIITFPQFANNEDWYTFVFVIKSFTGDLKSCDEGTLQWVAHDKILEYPMWEGDYVFIKWILENKGFFSARFDYENKRLNDYSVEFY